MSDEKEWLGVRVAFLATVDGERGTIFKTREDALNWYKDLVLSPKCESVTFRITRVYFATKRADEK